MNVNNPRFLSDQNVSSCCFSFTDARIVNGNVEKGKETDKDIRGAVVYTGKCGRKTFGTVSTKTDAHIRSALCHLSYGIILISPVRMAARSFSLLSGDFYRAGKKLARQQFLEEKSKDNTIGATRYHLLQAKHILWQLVKNIAQIVTYPFAAIAMGCVALGSAFANKPHDGRLLFGAIEDLWSQDVLEFPCGGLIGHYFSQVIHYIGPCQQPKEVWDKKDLYRMFNIYHPETIRSLLSRVISQLNKNRDFYESRDIPVTVIEKELDNYKKNIKNVSRKDQWELDERGEINHWDSQKGIADSLRKIKEYLDKVEEAALPGGLCPTHPIHSCDAKEKEAKEGIHEQLKRHRISLRTNWLVRSAELETHLQKEAQVQRLPDRDKFKKYLENAWMLSDYKKQLNDKMRQLRDIDSTLTKVINRFVVKVDEQGNLKEDSYIEQTKTQIDRFATIINNIMGEIELHHMEKYIKDLDDILAKANVLFYQHYPATQTPEEIEPIARKLMT